MSGRSTNKRSAAPKRRSQAPASSKSGPRPKPPRSRDSASRPRRASGMVPAVTTAAAQSEVERVLREVIRPLVEADGGDVDLVSIDDTKTPVEIALAVGGAYRGCPGTPLVARAVIEPALAKGLARDVRVRIVPRLG